jgi:drug/metabolite transporter (DMT)-like permease
MLGALLAVLSAAAFALNNAAARRGVITGTATQGVAITVPVGVICFLPATLIVGQASGFEPFPPSAAAWMTGVGLLHFLCGRYCNYRANQAAGVNLTAPVVQLQVVVTLLLAVVVLHETCTLLQMIGASVMLAGAFITQRQRTVRDPSPPPTGLASASGSASGARTFIPRYVTGYVFAALAALAYGTTPIMARTALAHSGPFSGILGGLIAYGAATAAIIVAMAASSLRRNVLTLARENVRWFVYSGVLVAIAQGLFYSAVSIAPIMLIVPLMQLSLIFRLLFATWLNADYELFGPLVIAGALISIVGACTVSIDTGLVLDALAVPQDIARILRLHV